MHDDISVSAKNNDTLRMALKKLLRCKIYIVSLISDGAILNADGRTQFYSFPIELTDDV